MFFFLVSIKSIASNTLAVDKHTLLQCVGGGVEQVHRACPFHSTTAREFVHPNESVIHDPHP